MNVIAQKTAISGDSFFQFVAKSRLPYCGWINIHCIPDTMLSQNLSWGQPVTEDGTVVRKGDMHVGPLFKQGRDQGS